MTHRSSYYLRAGASLTSSSPWYLKMFMGFCVHSAIAVMTLGFVIMVVRSGSLITCRRLQASVECGVDGSRRGAGTMRHQYVFCFFVCGRESAKDKINKNTSIKESKSCIFLTCRLVH
jgi:hypothetical protein